jgi:hypothetical protein
MAMIKISPVGSMSGFPPDSSLKKYFIRFFKLQKQYGLVLTQMCVLIIKGKKINSFPDSHLYHLREASVNHLAVSWGRLTHTHMYVCTSLYKKMPYTHVGDFWF